MCLCRASRPAARRPCRRGLGSCCPTRAKLDRSVESQPTHFPQPACGGAVGVPVSVWRGGHLRGPRGPARPCLYPWPLERSPISHPAPPQVPSGHRCACGWQWRARWKENVILPPHRSALSLSFEILPIIHANARELARLLAGLLSPECVSSALKQPTLCSHAIRFSDSDWLPLLSSGCEFQTLHR